jgi:hypothetical protein
MSSCTRCSETVLFEAGLNALLGKRIFNDSGDPGIGDSGQGGFVGGQAGIEIYGNCCGIGIGWCRCARGS